MADIILLSDLTEATTEDSADLALTQDVSAGTLKKISYTNRIAQLIAAAHTWSGVQTFSGIPVLSGGGITFPSTQVASSNVNTLDDYEEGTWTPVVYGSTTSGTGTYTTQTGVYIKIGSFVFVQIYINLSGHTGNGNMDISGLPFTASSVPYPPVSIGEFNNLSFTSGYIPTARIVHGTSYMELRQIPEGGGSVIAIPIDSVCNFSLSAVYKAA